MRDFLSLERILIIVSLVFVTSCFALAQDAQVAIVVIGDMRGEELRIRNDIINTSTKGVNGQKAYFSLGKADSSEMLNRISRTFVYLRKRYHIKFKKIDLPMPSTIKPYLILERNKRLKNSFSVTWSDSLPFKLLSEKLMAEKVDSASNVLPKPDLMIKLFGEPITAEQLRAINPAPGRLLPLSISVDRNDTQDIFPELKSVEILFVIQENQAVTRNTYGKSYAISLFWPDRFPLKDGSAMLINVVYEYVNRERQVMETGMIATRISF